MDLTPIVLALLAGGLGGLGYSYYNKLLSVSTYLQALEHTLAGAFAGLLGVFALGYVYPTDWATAFPLIVIGYGGTDVLDSFFQKLQVVFNVVFHIQFNSFSYNPGRFPKGRQWYHFHHSACHSVTPL